MTDEHISSRLAALLRTLTPKSKQPVSATVLNNWIAQAEVYTQQSLRDCSKIGGSGPSRQVRGLAGWAL